MRTVLATWSAPTVDDNGQPYDAATNLAGYSLEAKASTGIVFTEIAAPAADATSVEVQVDNTAYDFRLTAVDKNGNRSIPSTGSIEKAATPAAPGSFAVELV